MASVDNEPEPARGVVAGIAVLTFGLIVLLLMGRIG